MNRIDHSTATADKKFTEGSPAAAVPATVVTAAWLNVVQEELVKAVLAGGLSLSPTNDGQLGAIITSLLGSLALKAPLASPVFSGNPTAPTPPLFDNDLSLATTEFVQRALGNYRTLFGFTDSRTLTANHAGMFLVCGGTADTIVDLPSLAACPSGASLPYYNSGNFKVTLRCAANEKIAWHTAALGASLVELRPGETLILVSPGGGETWYPLGGTALLKMPTGPMRHSLAPNGHRQLPTGEMEVWGYGTTSAAGKASVTFARAFTVEVYAPLASLNSPGLMRNSLTVANATVTGMDIYACDGSGAALVGATVFYRVKGK